MSKVNKYNPCIVSLFPCQQIINCYQMWISIVDFWHQISKFEFTVTKHLYLFIKEKSHLIWIWILLRQSDLPYHKAFNSGVLASYRRALSWWVSTQRWFPAQCTESGKCYKSSKIALIVRTLKRCLMRCKIKKKEQNRLL